MKNIGFAKQFTARFTPKSTVSYIAHRYISAFASPVRPKIQHLCDSRDRNTLWWRVSVGDINGQKRVVRSWCARRLRSAFIQELAARGFDKDGRRLNSDVDCGFPGNMTGTLYLEVSPACMRGAWPALREEVKVTMAALIQEQQAMRIAQKNRQQRTPQSRAPRKAARGRYANEGLLSPG